MSSVSCIVCSPPGVWSPSVTIYLTTFTPLNSPPHPLPLWEPSYCCPCLCVCESTLFPWLPGQYTLLTVLTPHGWPSPLFLLGAHRSDLITWHSPDCFGPLFFLSVFTLSGCPLNSQLLITPISWHPQPRSHPWNTDLWINCLLNICTRMPDKYVWS